VEIGEVYHEVNKDHYKNPYNDPSGYILLASFTSPPIKTNRYPSLISQKAASIAVKKEDSVTVPAVISQKPE
jgi:hypothetical protein